MKVRLLPVGVELEVGPGQRLLDALDDAERVAFAVACRAANCGSCRLRVVHGAEALLEPTARERALLLQLRAADDERLGCQLVIGDSSATELLLDARRAS